MHLTLFFYTISFMRDFLELSNDECKEWLKSEGHEAYHADQIFQWIYNKSTLSFDAMSNLSKEMRAKLTTSFRFPGLELIKISESNDKETLKFLFRLNCSKLVESVLILSGPRRTVCVSSQVGCPAKCAFCASGKMGFFRNLRPFEIVAQVLIINHYLASKGEKVSHVVYMGMGEPFKNYDSVVKSIEVLSDPNWLNISQRRITVSTVGIVEGIKRLSLASLKVNLVLSLHAPNQHIRQKIIPYARKYPLDEIMLAMDEYSKKTKRDITYEYTLLSGINDHPDHAFELANLLKGKQCTVNLIPYNPVQGLKLKRPDKGTIKQFRSVLFGSKINNTCRYTKGDDIAAACGQLAMQEEKL